MQTQVLKMKLQMEENSIWEDFIKEVTRELKDGQIQTG